MGNTPAMQQYIDIKKKHPDSLVLFRMGDFYETFYDDARKAAAALDITLTSRGNKNGMKIPLAGIPYHALDNYLPKLVQKGIKVAIVEQLEDPKLAKGVVKRDVVRIVTPGTVLESSILDEKNNNYLAAVCPGYGLSFADLSTGEVFCSETEKPETEINKWKPAEIIIPESLDDPIVNTLDKAGYVVSRFEDWRFIHEQAEETLMRHFAVNSLDGLGLRDKDLAVCAAGAIINYLEETQRQSIDHIQNIRYISLKDYLMLDGVTIRNLELVENIREKGNKNTLLSIIDKTSTAMGSRMIRTWLLNPLIDIKSILKRQAGVSELHANTLLRSELQEILKNIKDIERLTAKLSLGTIMPRDLLSLKSSLDMVPVLKNALIECEADILQELCTMNDPIDAAKLIGISIKDEPASTIREGGFIRRGYDHDLDELHDIIKNGKGYIRDLEKKEAEKTGIMNLRIKYNRVFGYFLEVTKKHLDKVPEHYIRRQTMANCERYVTDELKEMEEKVLGAEEKINAMEFDIYQRLLAELKEQLKVMQESARMVAVLDSLNSLALVAALNSYAKPEINDGFGLELNASRHPIIEQIEQSFISNDIHFDEKSWVHIITGPNMAGKSTVMRQVALTIILAQIGSFVPAKKAKIGIIDKVFSRVGAHDDITHGQSTFMVEMNEVSSIINNATQRSFIVMDEIGRGTSTFDGVSIAWAVAEYIAKELRCKTMFATHYHVLTDLEKVKGIRNYNIAVREDKDKIFFLRKLVPGGTDKSYGIHVAKLSGMPKDVIDRAKEIQFKLEDEDSMRERIVVEKQQENNEVRYRKSYQKTLSEL